MGLWANKQYVGNLWFVQSIGCNVKFTQYTNHKLPVYEMEIAKIPRSLQTYFSCLTYLSLEHLIVQLEECNSGHAHIPQETLHTTGRAPPPLTGVLLQQQG